MDLNKIYETSNYNEFDWTEINRDINDNHVKKLEADIDSNMGIIMPVLVNPQRVNGKLQVPDGQHRLCALKRKGLPIRYIFAPYQMKLNDITRINSQQQPWKTIDYVKAYAKAGKEDYIRLMAFYEEVLDRVEKSKHIRKVSIRSVSYLSQGNGSNPNISIKDNIKTGRWKFRQTEEQARKDLNMFMQFEKFGSCLTETFIQAVYSIMNNQEGFDIKHLIRQTNKYPWKFVSCSRGQDWMRMIEELYNHCRSEKNRIYFRFRK